MGCHPEFTHLHATLNGFVPTSILSVKDIEKYTGEKPEVIKPYLGSDDIQGTLPELLEKENEALLKQLTAVSK